MRTPGPQLQRACACGGACSECQPKKESQAREQLQLRRVRASDAGIAAAPPFVHDVLATPGLPLDADTRAFMEPRFGYNFSQVRIHADAKASASARAVNALAYTVGQDVVFGAGQYVPGTSAGQRLLAHELTHVVQQDGGQSQRATELPQSGLRLQRQHADLYARLNEALSQSDWEGAVRVLMEMSDADARTGLSALTSEARTNICSAAMRIDASPDNRVARLVEEAEFASRPAPAAPAPTPAPAPAPDVASLSAAERLGRAWGHARGRMIPEAQRALADLFSLSSLAAMGGFILAYLAAHATPVGWVADAIALATLTVAAFFMGRLLFDIVEDLFAFFSAVNATTEAELRTAGQALARAVARGGVQIVVLLLTRRLRGSLGRGSPPPRTPPPSGAAELVTPEGLIVLPEAIPELPPGPRVTGGGGASGSALRSLPRPRTAPPTPGSPARPAPPPAVETPPSPPARPGRAPTAVPETPPQPQVSGGGSRPEGARPRIEPRVPRLVPAPRAPSAPPRTETRTEPDEAPAPCPPGRPVWSQMARAAAVGVCYREGANRLRARRARPPSDWVLFNPMRGIAHRTVCAILAVVDRNGCVLAEQLSSKDEGDREHPEQQAMRLLGPRIAAIPADQRAGASLRVIVTLTPCVAGPQCDTALRTFAQTWGLTYLPTPDERGPYLWVFTGAERRALVPSFTFEP